MTLPGAGIWLDAQGTQNRDHFDRGIPRYINEQAHAIVDLVPGAIGAVGLNRALPLSGNVDWLLGSGLVQWDRIAEPRAIAGTRLYHVMSPFELGRSLDEIWPRWVRRRPETKTVVTLYDLIPLIFADHYLRVPHERARYLARVELVRCADHVLALSQTTADDAIERLHLRPERLTVIDAGVASSFADAGGRAGDSDEDVRRRFGELRKGYMLYVAGIEFRKNVERLIAAHGLTTRAFRSAHQLVITCRMRPEEGEYLQACAQQAGLDPEDLLLTGYVTDVELASLYRGCELFVFASFYEGSGLPLLEAMASGAPVAASRTSTSPEILGDLLATFDPFDPGDIARVLETTLADEALMDRLRERSRLRVAEYTWHHVARRSLEGYERALEQGAARTPWRSRRPRIALFTPWPPERSGIAQYNRRLVQELGRRVDVDVLVGGDRSDYPHPEEMGTSLIQIDKTRWHREMRLHDRVVYCMGNSHFHGQIYEAMRTQSGVVVAHDVRLTGFYGWYAGSERPTDPAGRLGERITAMYGDRVGSFDRRPPTRAEQSALGIYMTHEVQEYAERMIVHSDYAADILRLDRPLRGPAPPPVTVLPLAFPDRPDRPALRGDPEAPLIVSFGVVSWIKNPQVMIEAFALLAAGRPRAKFVLAGGGDPARLDHWREVAADYGVAERVSFRGHVSTTEWDRLLWEADLALQLRLVSNGEASAAVTDCMACGVPVVVTDHGWFAELPDDAVVKVPIAVTARSLAAAIAAVLDVPGRGAELAAAAVDHARANSFDTVATAYLEALDLM